MNTLAIKIIFILGFICCHNVFADYYVEEIEWEEGEQYYPRDTNKTGMIRASKRIHYKEKHSGEFIEAIYNRKGKLMFYKRQILKNGIIIQLDYDGIVMYIISGKTPCDFTVVEPSGDTISFNLDPRKEPKNPYIKENRAFLNSEIPPKDKKHIHDVIIFDRWNHGCRHTAGFW